MALYMRTNGVTKKVGTSSPSAIPASNSTYDNTQSGLSADNVQNAIDEINSNLTELLTLNELPTPTSVITTTSSIELTVIKSGMIFATSNASTGTDNRFTITREGVTSIGIPLISSVIIPFPICKGDIITLKGSSSYRSFIYPCGCIATS